MTKTASRRGTVPGAVRGGWGGVGVSRAGGHRGRREVVGGSPEGRGHRARGDGNALPGRVQRIRDRSPETRTNIDVTVKGVSSRPRARRFAEYLTTPSPRPPGTDSLDRASPAGPSFARAASEAGKYTRYYVCCRRLHVDVRVHRVSREDRSLARTRFIL